MKYKIPIGTLACLSKDRFGMDIVPVSNKRTFRTTRDFEFDDDDIDFKVHITSHRIPKVIIKLPRNDVAKYISVWNNCIIAIESNIGKD